MSDAGLLWSWANDPSVRANSFNPQLITWEDHVSWYADKLASPETRIWLLEQNQIPVAQIRYDKVNSETARISYVVDGCYRGQGFGTCILQMTLLLAAQALNVSVLEGETFANNIASIRAFEKAEFALAETRVLAGQSVKVFRRRVNGL